MGDLASREGDISWLEHVQMGFGQFEKLELTYSHHAFRWHMFSKLTKVKLLTLLRLASKLSSVHDFPQTGCGLFVLRPKFPF